VCAKAGATHRVQADQVGGKDAAGVGRVDALFVQGMAGFMRGAEHRGRQVVTPVAGRDAHILAREGHLKRMHRGVEAPALQVIAQVAGQGQAKAALIGFRKLTEQEVAPAWRLGAGRRHNGPQAVAQRGKQLLQRGGGFARFIQGHHGVVGVALPACAIGIAACQRHGFFQMRGEKGEVAAATRLDPGRLGHGAQRGPLLRQRGRDAAVVRHSLPHLGHHVALDRIGRQGLDRVFGRSQRCFGLWTEQLLQSQSGQGRDLLASRLCAPGGHHGA
jgi:hypothetical protein